MARPIARAVLGASGVTAGSGGIGGATLGLGR